MNTEILATAACARCDRYAGENGVSSQTLMRKAGAAVADAIRARWAPRRVLVLAGPGNNGGDGMIAAAALREAGWPVRIVLVGDPETLTGDAAWAFAQWNGEVGGPDPVDPGDADLVIDALFGAGLSRPVDGRPARWLAAILSLGAPVIAIDLPSGLDGDARMLSDVPAPAVLTVTFHRPKPAHLLEPWAETCGEIVCADIGIPDGWQSDVEPVARRVILPAWPSLDGDGLKSAHKHSRGRVAVFGGGAQSSGAARLSATAALRAGAGLVTLCSPPSAALVNAVHLTAVMLTRWQGGADTMRCLAELRAQAAVLGPAMGVGDATREAVLSALGSGIPLVLDADALTSFEDEPGELMAALHPDCVLTPHDGEFSRLFGADEGTRNRVERAQMAADRASCTVLLKGPATVVASPGKTPLVNTHASPWLATAGSGDVLAGMIAAGLAAGMDPHLAAASAAWLHGDAGRRLGAGLIAGDLIEILPVVMQGLARERRRGNALSHLLAHGR